MVEFDSEVVCQIFPDFRGEVGATICDDGGGETEPGEPLEQGFAACFCCDGAEGVGFGPSSRSVNDGEKVLIALGGGEGAYYIYVQVSQAGWRYVEVADS